jgi:RNA polymerase sigma-70 factor (ECF subfamily)
MTAITVDQRDSFESTALPHLDSLYRFALGLAGDAQDAEDLVQETMLKAHRAWDRFREGGNVRGWLMTILRNTFFNERRRARHTRVVQDVMEIESYTVFDGVQDADPEGDFFGQLVDESIWRAINSLPEEYREVLVLREVEGMTYDDIARLLEINIGTVKSRLFRARKGLQPILRDYAAQEGYVAAADAPPEESDSVSREVEEAIREITGEFVVAV